MAAFDGRPEADGDGFQVVRHKRGKRRVRQSHAVPDVTTIQSEYSAGDLPVDTDRLKRRIQQCRDELLGSDFYAQLINSLERAVACALCSVDCDTTTDTESPSPDSGDCQDPPAATGRAAIVTHNLDWTQQRQNTDSRQQVHTHTENTTTVSCSEGRLLEETWSQDCLGSQRAAPCRKTFRGREDIEFSSIDSSGIQTPAPCDKVFRGREGIQGRDIDQEGGDSVKGSAQLQRGGVQDTIIQLKCGDTDQQRPLSQGCGESQNGSASQQRVDLQDTVLQLSSDGDEGLRSGGGGMTGGGGGEQGITDGALTMVVYGLGNFTSCAIARYQLALVLALQDRLKIKPFGCLAYDPQFTNTEKQLLEDFGFTLILQNEEGKRNLEGTTLMVMPHCGKALFNNLLWANWSPRQLQRLVVLGNSFAAMLESMPQRLWIKSIGHIAMLEGHMMEVSVKNNFPHTDIFNDLSVHWFPAPLLGDVAADTWSHTEVPVYDFADVEIILQSNT